RSAAAVGAGGIGARASPAAGAPMSAHVPMTTFERRTIDVIVRMYPAELRADHGPEMKHMCARMCADAMTRRPAARARVWLRLATDTLRSAPVEHWHAWRERARERAAVALSNGVPKPDYSGA